MGLYDYIVCKMPLPGEKPSWLKDDHAFQTKSLNCMMETYTIDVNGHFGDGFTGIIEFYDSNIVGSGPGLYTREGEDIEDVTYEAEVVGGVVKTLEQTHYSRQAAWPSSRQTRHWVKFTPAQLAMRDEREKQDRTGSKLYVLWGGQEKGYWVHVINQHECQLVTRKEDGEFEILDTRNLDRTLWENEEEALEAKRSREEWWATERAEYEAHVESEGGIHHSAKVT